MRHLETRIEGEVGTITIDHPAKRNALSRQLVDAIVEALDRLSQERVRAIVLRAKPGVKVWSSGHDVEELPEGGRDPLGWDDPLRYLVRAIEEHPASCTASRESLRSAKARAPRWLRITFGDQSRSPKCSRA
jgi:methylmalonyl-CoA decarboxylase